MAVTDEVVARFSGPSVWRESDCIQWLAACTGLDVPASTVWYRECDTEARAIARAVRVHGSYRAAVEQGLHIHGYHSVALGTDYEPGDIVIVQDPTYGELPAGVAPGPQLLIRHAWGVSPASGEPLHHLRRA